MLIEVVLDTKKRKYLTKNYNSFFQLIKRVSGDLGEKENGLSEKNFKKSGLVASQEVN